MIVEIAMRLPLSSALTAGVPNWALAGVGCARPMTREQRASWSGVEGKPWMQVTPDSWQVTLPEPSVAKRCAWLPAASLHTAPLSTAVMISGAAARKRSSSLVELAVVALVGSARRDRSEEHTSELQ